MERWLKKLQKLLQLNDKYDPWIDEASTLEILDTVKEELDELYEAIKNNDHNNIKEELGDLLWTALLSALSIKRNYDANLEEVVDMLEKKMRNRKPYMFEGKKPSLKEAAKIWFEAKEREAKKPR